MKNSTMLVDLLVILRFRCARTQTYACAAVLKLLRIRLSLANF